jgi:hypothetical protein
MIDGSRDDLEAAAARLVMRKGALAHSEARYQIELAQRRFYASLAKTGRELEALEFWVSMSKLVDGGESRNEPGQAAPPPR